MTEGLSRLLASILATTDDSRTAGTACGVAAARYKLRRQPGVSGPESVTAAMGPLGSSLLRSLACWFNREPSLCSCCPLSAACNHAAALPPPPAPDKEMLQLCAVCARVHVCGCAGGAGCLSPATAVQEVLCPELAQEPGGGRLAPRSHQACSHPANTLVFLKRHPRA